MRMVQGRRRRVVATLVAALTAAATASVAPVAVSAAPVPCKVVNARTGASTSKLQSALDKAAAGDTLRITPRAAAASGTRRASRSTR